MLETAVIIAIVAGATAVVCLLIRAIYASKCKTVECGCIKIERQVEIEPSLRHLNDK